MRIEEISGELKRFVTSADESGDILIRIPIPVSSSISRSLSLIPRERARVWLLIWLKPLPRERTLSLEENTFFLQMHCYLTVVVIVTVTAVTTIVVVIVVTRAWR